MRWLWSVSRWGLWWVWPFGSHDNCFSFCLLRHCYFRLKSTYSIPIDFFNNFMASILTQVKCKTALNIISTRRKRTMGNFSTRNLDACRTTFAQTSDLTHAALYHRWLINFLYISVCFSYHLPVDWIFMPCIQIRSPRNLTQLFWYLVL